VNVLVGLEVLKAGFGWSDADLYENYCFNLQVRYALGYDRLGDGDFAIRTLYYFRERLSKHYLASGANLLEQVFEQVTDAQLRGGSCKCAPGCSAWIRPKSPATSWMPAACNCW
jgi:hypothetical protein